MFIFSLVWTSDPIVPGPTAGALDRKASLYVVNTLILSSASPAHVHSRPKSYLTWKIPMCSLTKERGGLKEGQGLLFGQGYPYKTEFIDPLAEQCPRQTVTVQQSRTGAISSQNFCWKLQRSWEKRGWWDKTILSIQKSQSVASVVSW